MATSDIPGDIEQTRRRQVYTGAASIASGISAAPTQQAAPKLGAMKPAGQPAPSSLPAGIGLTPEQIEAHSRAEGRRRGAESIQRTNAAVGRTFDAAGNAIGTAKNSILSIGTGVVDAVRNANVQHLPDYSTPAKDAIKPGPTPQQQAGGIMAFDMAKRATDAGIAYDRQMRAMPRPPADIPNTLKAPQADGTKTSSGGTSSSSAPGGQQAGDGSVQPGGPGQWGNTGIGVGRNGGEIVGRVNGQGIAEFSNLAGDQQSGAGQQFSAAGLRPQRGNVPAQPGIGLPAGARALASGSSVPSGSDEFARLGSAANVGRGIGSGPFAGISGGEAGDARMAIDRFERANAERGRMVDVQREIDAMRGLTGVRGITEGLSSDPIKARRQIREADIRQGDEGLAAGRAEVRQRGIDAGLDRSLRQRELAGSEQRNQLEAQLTRQKIGIGDVDLAQQQRLADLRTQLADPSVKDDARQQLLQTYNSLMYSPKDRYMEVRGGTDANGNKAPSMVFDSASGRYVEQQGGQGGRPVGTRSVVGDRVAVWDGGRWVEER